MPLETLAARAYYNHGRWVADCPSEYCNSAEELRPGQREAAALTVALGMLPEEMHAEVLELYQRNAKPVEPRLETFFCRHCLTVAPVEWPDNADDIEVVLDRRPDRTNRNWYPVNHPLALLSGRQHGQTVDDLRRENRDNGVDDEPARRPVEETGTTVVLERQPSQEA